MKKIFISAFVLALLFGFTKPRSLDDIIEDFKAIGVTPTSVTDNTANWDKGYISEVCGESETLVKELLLEHEVHGCKLMEFSSAEAAQKWVESDYIQEQQPKNDLKMIYTNGPLVLDLNFGWKDMNYQLNDKMIEAFMK